MERRVASSEIIRAVKLSVYQANQIAQGRTFLVGDAAFGVPFFRKLLTPVSPQLSHVRPFTVLHSPRYMGV